MSNDPAEGGTREDNSATSLSSAEPLVGGHRQPDNQSEAGSAVDEPDGVPVEVDRLVADEGASNPRGEALFSTENEGKLRREWDAAQKAFVDDPRAAVERADHLVVETIRTLSTSFDQQRSRLEEQWVRGESASTEDLRVALRLYRSFFDRLLSI